jgi:hypothetical protein
MTDKRKFPKSGRRNLVDYATFVANQSDYVMVCVNRAVLDVARLFMAQRAQWATTYVDSYDDDGYYPVDDTQMDNIKELVAEFLESTGTMNCDDFISELNDIEAAILALGQSAGAGCCADGSGGVSPDTPYLPYTDDGVNPPTGFPDYPTYDTHKCNAAQYWLNNWQQDIGWIKTLDTAAVTTAILGAGLLIPGINLGVLVGLLLYLIALAAFGSSLQNILDWIAANEDDLLCDVYNGATASDAAANVIGRIDAGSLSTLEAQVAKLFVSAAAINEAFGAANVPALGADCSACVCPAYDVWTGIETVAPLVQVDSTDNGNRHEMEVRFNYDGVGYCGPEITLNDLSWLSGVDCATDNWFYTRVYSQSVQIFGQQGTCSFETFRATLPRSDVARVLLTRSYPQTYSHSPFSVGFDWSP